MATLDLYRAKRDFSRTREPKGGSGGKKAAIGGAFVIHKHAARRLHYDLRLEHDGVLWSWAVTRGPSLDPDEKRLAVHVEDHPLEYGAFEGTIPKGEYGAGSVIIWDEGIWAPEGDPAFGMAKGHLSFMLKGHKLAGQWHLVRLKPRKGETRDNWLLMKVDDEAARSDEDILETAPDSVKSGLSVEAVARGEAPGKKSGPGPGGRERTTSRRNRPNPRRSLPPEQPASPPRRASMSPRLCRTSSSPAWRRCRTSRRPARAGCTRSSSTAIASRPASPPARRRC